MRCLKLVCLWVAGSTVSSVDPLLIANCPDVLPPCEYWRGSRDAGIESKGACHAVVPAVARRMRVDDEYLLVQIRRDRLHLAQFHHSLTHSLCFFLDTSLRSSRKCRSLVVLCIFTGVIASWVA
jgi:hypothetical protein